MDRFLGRRTAVAAALLVVALALLFGAAAIWGLPWRTSDSERASRVLTPFVEALRQKDFESACDALASNVPAMKDGPSGCPSRVRRGFGSWDWGAQLPSTHVRFDGSEDGRLYASVFSEGGLFDVGPVFRFTLVRDREAWRIAHMDGFF